MNIVAIIFAFFYYSASVVLGQELRILPDGDSFTRAVGTNIVFTCEVYRLGPQMADINLQWFDRDGQEIRVTAGPGRLLYVEKEENLPTKKLYFTDIRNEHAGSYFCEGLIGGNKQRKAIQLLLFQGITFIDARSPQYPVIYTPAHIICRVTGQPVPTVSWRYRGQKITSSFSDRYVQDQSGLIIKNVTKEDDGIYTCRAEVDADGRYDERPINVIVNIPPKMITRSVKHEATQSQEYALSCQATGFPDPKYDFYKDDNLNPLYSTNRFSVDRDSGTIFFRPLHKEDQGEYRCVAFNNAGKDEGILSLRVLVPPTIVPITNVTQSEDLATTLVCNSNGDPPPEMAFRKTSNSDYYTMGDNEGGRITMTNPMSGRLELVIRNLKPEDMSNYTCRSRNVAGNHERNGTITVNFKPRFAANQIKQLNIWPGKTRNITCNVLAEPMPSIEWIRFQYPLRNNETFRVYSMGKNSNLQVTAREYDVLWMFGNYTCRARNSHGQTDTNINLIRAVLPGPPKSVSIVEITPDRVILSAEPPISNGGEEIIGYRLDYEDKIYTFPVGESILIEHLRPSTTFQMRVRALSEVGYGEYFPVTVRTKDVEPPSQLVLLEGTPDVNSHTILWEKPITGGQPIEEYEFRYRPVDGESKSDDNWSSFRRQEKLYEMKLYHVLLSLKSGTTYEIEIRARNSVGWSPYAQQTFTTIGDPDDPRNVKDNCSATRSGFKLIIISAMIALILRRSEHEMSSF